MPAAPKRTRTMLGARSPEFDIDDAQIFGAEERCSNAP